MSGGYCPGGGSPRGDIGENAYCFVEKVLHKKIWHKMHLLFAGEDLQVASCCSSDRILE